MAQNDLKFCVLLHISGTAHHILWCLVHICKMMISPANFFIFESFDFWGFYQGKRAKNDLKLPVSVHFALYLRTCRSYHQDVDNDVYKCFSLLFLKKCVMENTKIILFFVDPLQKFLMIICFWSSSINSKKNSEVLCPTFFTCVWFLKMWIRDI